MNKFIFDVDGTLTPSRQLINPVFKNFFHSFCTDNDVYIVTGSDHQKTIDQLGDYIVNNVTTVYNCSGNDVWQHGKNIKRNNWTLPNKCRRTLEYCLEISKFPIRTGTHIEERPGTVNFSIIGRGATIAQRNEYIAWDIKQQERESIALQFNMAYKDLTAVIGGDTGIDIYPTGYDKSQIIKDFDTSVDNIYFFGDKTMPGGNDAPLAILVQNSYQVKSWRDTYKHLIYLQEEKIAQ